MSPENRRGPIEYTKDVLCRFGAAARGAAGSVGESMMEMLAMHVTDETKVRQARELETSSDHDQDNQADNS